MNKYEFGGQVFVEMPAILVNDCRGCYFEDGVNLDTDDRGTTPCPHTKNVIVCHSESPVLVLNTPEHIADYVAHRLEHS